MGNYMENYREEMAAEITTKVVHSLGIVIDNKLAGLLDRRAEAKVDESDFAKKVRKDKVKVKKVKTEAMRMTMEMGEESIESKELKKLKKSLIKKTDKVVKVAMKIEKKNHQEQKGRKASLSSCCNSEQLQALKLSEKKEKKAPKVKEEKKAKDEKKTKKSKPKKDIIEKDDEENVIKAPAGVDTDKDCVPVVTSQPRQRGPEVVLPNLEDQKRFKEVVLPNLEDQGDSDDLPAALLLPNGSPTMVGQAGKILKTSVPVVNLGCAAWGEEARVEESFSSEGLTSCPATSMALPQLQPGQEGNLDFQFTAPSSSGEYESVWHFWLAGKRFGPPLAFAITVPAVEKKEGHVKDMELLDFSNSGGQEMTNLGSSAAALDMVEMGRSRNETQKSRDEQERKDKEDFACLNLPDLDGLSLNDSKTTLEVDSVTISDKGGEDSEEDSDFEVIPLPDCFNLEVPFELVDQGESEGEGNNKVNSVDEGEPSKKAAEEDSKKPLEEAIAAVRLLEEKLSGSKGVQLPSITNDLDIWLEPKSLRVG